MPSPTANEVENPMTGADDSETSTCFAAIVAPAAIPAEIAACLYLSAPNQGSSWPTLLAQPLQHHAASMNVSVTNRAFIGDQRDEFPQDTP